VVVPLLRAAGVGFGGVALTKSSGRRVLVVSHLRRAGGVCFGGVTLAKSNHALAQGSRRQLWRRRTC
jgi:hypothetical protein